MEQLLVAYPQYPEYIYRQIVLCHKGLSLTLSFWPILCGYISRDFPSHAEMATWGLFAFSVICFDLLQNRCVSLSPRVTYIIQAFVCSFEVASNMDNYSVIKASNCHEVEQAIYTVLHWSHTTPWSSAFDLPVWRRAQRRQNIRRRYESWERNDSSIWCAIELLPRIKICAFEWILLWHFWAIFLYSWNHTNAWGFPLLPQDTTSFQTGCSTRARWAS